MIRFAGNELEIDLLNSEYLFKLAHEKSREGRSALAETVTDLFLDEGELTDIERAMMFDILHRLVRDVELSVRKHLAEVIADAEDVPKELITFLANDQIEVAYPVLIKSRVLEDADLIEIIRQRTQEHQLAVSIRDSLSEQVSDALVETGDEEVIRSLLENSNAKIAEGTMNYLVEQAMRIDSFQGPILRREELSSDQAKKLLLLVSAALRDHILERFDISAQELDRHMGNVVRERIRALPSGIKLIRPSEALVKEMEDIGMSGPDLMLTVLDEGAVPLFIELFRNWASLSSKLAQRILYERKGEGLAIVFKAMDTDLVTFMKIFVLTRKVWPQTDKVLKKESRKISELYKAMTHPSAEMVLNMWQNDSEYLAAIRELKLGEAKAGDEAR